LAVIAASPPADAQQVRGIAKVGVLVSNDQPGAARFLEGFKDGLQMLGYAEGKSLVLEAVIQSSGNPVAMAQRAEVASLAQRNHLPSIYAIREYVDVGGLLSYGPSIGDMWRRTATYVDKILKGVKPADLTVEQPTKFELVINLTTAKALGLTIPPSLLRRADDVIR
jgi:putative ABC transport system substrate-binding protein